MEINKFSEIIKNLSDEVRELFEYDEFLKMLEIQMIDMKSNILKLKK